MNMRSKTLLGSLAGIVAFSLASCDISSVANENGDAKTEAATSIKRAPIGRLPELSKPTFYKLDMRVDPREEGFSGTATIDIALLKATDVIWLHGKDLDVSRVVIEADGETFTADWDEVLPTGVARIDFGKELSAGSIKVTIDYSAQFDGLLRGLFRVEEQGDAYALAKSESIQARRFLPGYDEPGYKNVFDISLTIPENYEAISNAPELTKTPADERFVKVQFDQTRPLPTYLLSIAVGPFDIVDYAPLPPNEVRSEPIPLRGIARRGRGADLEYALSVTDDLIEIFETELKVPYPYKKLDIVAAPQWPSGATELAGAISYRESRILYNDALGEGARRSLLGIHTHEIAHMWFGDLVTPPWWDDLWLKESFATWGTPISLIEFEPNGRHELDALSSAQRAMGLDSIDSARAIREPIYQNQNIRNAYDGITYSKGMAVIRMIDSYFGPDVFRPALGRYVTDNVEELFRIRNAVFEFGDIS
ncbi:MAG: M1 family metallopeptidase, partial [Pseudomonadota bacterium]